MKSGQCTRIFLRMNTSQIQLLSSSSVFTLVGRGRYFGFCKAQTQNSPFTLDNMYKWLRSLLHGQSYGMSFENVSFKAVELLTGTVTAASSGPHLQDYRSQESSYTMEQNARLICCQACYLIRFECYTLNAGQVFKNPISAT